MRKLILGFAVGLSPFCLGRSSMSVLALRTLVPTFRSALSKLRWPCLPWMLR